MWRALFCECVSLPSSKEVCQKETVAVYYGLQVTCITLRLILIPCPKYQEMQPLHLKTSSSVTTLFHGKVRFMTRLGGSLTNLPKLKCEGNALCSQGP